MRAFYIINRLKSKIRRQLLKCSTIYTPSFVFYSPIYIQIESTNICNLRCIMCPINKLTSSREPKNLTLKEFEYIILQFPFLKYILLQGIGEPLNNPQIIDIIEKGRSKHIFMGFITNGTLLNKKIGSELIKVGQNYIGISLDSVNPQNYESIRRGAKFEQVVENIERLLSLRKSLKTSELSIEIVVVIMNRNVQELIDIINFAYELGVDSINIRGLNPAFNPSLEAQNIDVKIEKIFAFSKVLMKRRDFNVICFALPKKGDKKMRCRWPWCATYITVEGDITPCCHCPDARLLSFGNIFNKPFREIWNNSSYKNFRIALKTGKPPFICRSCPEYQNLLYGWEQASIIERRFHP